MIPLWITSLLGASRVEEFLYNSKYTLHLKGELVNGEWIVDIYVNALPYFAWGSNRKNTKMTGSFRNVVSYYLMVMLNQLTEYSAEGREEVSALMRGYFV